MATFLYKTRGNASPERKPRVYFTCHPEDFPKYFEKICEDIFKTHDCAIFYTEDLNEEIEERYRESDLGQMNLFVIPITFKLLTQPNRAMDSDFRFAKEKHIPILPILMDSGLEAVYSRKDKFGELQYLDPYAQDITAISYEEKLKRYLDFVLISRDLTDRVRKAFDAYIFLSYRKKDRHYANELMKTIHNHPEFRDIAIWYDEFLTPGESFCENIERMMRDSKLFALLVTPNLLEYVDGKPNYVMAHEYPDAKNTGMDILPTEMEATDRDELRSKFEGIPDCVRLDEETAFKKRLADTLSKMAVFKRNDDPEHDFLIGLAYFDGIDVEVDYNKAITLITDAADHGLMEAQKKLVHLYTLGKGVEINKMEAIRWQKKIVNALSHKIGDAKDEESVHRYLEQELILGELQCSSGDLKAARNTCWRVLKNCKNDGRYGPLFSEGRRLYFVQAYVLLGDVFKDREDYAQAKECYEKALKEIEIGFDGKPSEPIFLDIIGKAYLKLGQLHLIPHQAVLLERIESYFEKSISAFLALCDTEHTKDHVKNVIHGYTALCKLYLRYFGSSRKEALVKANQAAIDLLETMRALAPKDSHSLEYCEALLTRGDVQRKYGTDDSALKTYQRVLDELRSIPKPLRSIAICDCICRTQVKLAEIFQKQSNREDCERHCFAALELATQLHEETGRLRFLSYMAEIQYIHSFYHAPSGRDAFTILSHVYDETTAYDEQFFRIRRSLWERKILCENDFPVKYLHLADKSVQSHTFLDEDGKKYEIDLYFVTRCPKQNVIGLRLCDLTLTDNRRARTNRHPMRIQLAEIGSSGCRSNSTPDELVSCVFEDGTSVTYQQCYG